MVDRDAHAHDILFLNLQMHLLLGDHQRDGEHLILHHATRHRHVAVGLFNAGLHLTAEGFVLPYKVKELAHQLIALILEELMPLARGGKLAL